VDQGKKNQKPGEKKEGRQHPEGKGMDRLAADQVSSWTEFSG
jgi:hypothetical protein